ncbi:hypothetical protein CU254_16880 [Amycolatopsis sp. AA4]|nr:hypothetical protein CU254_16880 [Amycolatopsis sp. AA4]
MWKAIASPPGADGWAQRVCLACAETMGRVDAAILSLRAGPRSEQVLGASDPWAARLAELEYTAGEGPGTEAFETGSAVLVPDLTIGQVRWPGFAQTALATGLGAAFAFPLRFGDVRLGTLELVRHRPGELAAAETRDAALAADLTTAALLRQSREAERAGREFAPSTAVSYQDVHIATGMLAARLRISLDDAFARLRAHAYSSNRPLLDVAKDVLERRTTLEEPSE